ncbi:hypothetical protein Y032_0334g2849 [Ancylostoma ceylanicum]|nr:hypothetical protein Y032_0334g2849 [Ancylostoma ceylanicum]
MVGGNSYAHLQGCPLEETRPLICVGAMILRIRLVSSHPRPRSRSSTVIYGNLERSLLYINVQTSHNASSAKLEMLGNVIAQKRGRRRKRNSLVPLAIQDDLHIEKETQPNSDSKTCPGTQIRRNNPRRGVQDVSNHKITDFFPVRRSSRKTGKQLEEEEKYALRDAIHNLTNEALLEIYIDEKKGRGIRAAKSFIKNEFVVEYKGDMMDYNSAKIREEEYAKDPSIGSYMYFFKYKSKRWCVDATKESEFKGRLINHSALRPNLRTKVVEFDGELHLILVAKRDIDEAEELLYDYGDRTPETVARNPWLVNS